MTDCRRHFFLILTSSFPKHRVTPDECGFASSDGNPGTNGATSKTRCGTRINTTVPALQARICPPNFLNHQAKNLGAADSNVKACTAREHRPGQGQGTL